MRKPRKADLGRPESGGSSESMDNHSPSETKKSGRLGNEVSSSSHGSMDEPVTNEAIGLTDRRVDTEKSEEMSSQLPSKTCRSCKKADSVDKMIDPCECKNSNQWIHLDCLARLMNQTNEVSVCSACKADYKTDRFRLSRRAKSCLDFFTQNRTNFAYLIEIPLSLGFMFLLLALGLIQYEQSYKIVYLKWSIILVFLIVLIVLNHIALFLTNLYQLVARVRQFRATNFRIVIEANE